jgi:hypothetical protein
MTYNRNVICPPIIAANPIAEPAISTPKKSISGIQKKSL